LRHSWFSSNVPYTKVEGFWVQRSGLKNSQPTLIRGITFFSDFRKPFHPMGDIGFFGILINIVSSFK